MHYNLNTFTRYSIPLLSLAIFVSFFGCEAQNPVCTDNFCFVGEAFPRSELEAGQEFSEIDIDDSVIFATLIGTPTPVETTPVIEPPVNQTPESKVTAFVNIVADVAAGGTKYLEKTVTIVAPVRFKLETAVTLFTDNEDVNFFVKSDENPAILDQFDAGRTYRLKVYIRQIDPPDAQHDTFAVFSDADKDFQAIAINPVKVGVKKVVDTAASGDTNYVGKTIEVRAEVLLNIAGSGLALKTDNAKVRWFVVNTPDPTVFTRFEASQTYTFTLFIPEIQPPDPSALKDYYIISSTFVAAK